MSIAGEIKESFKQGTTLTRLIYINIAIFLTFRFIQLFLVLGGNAPDAIQSWLSFFSVPANPGELLQRPWTPFTYMFLHFDFLHMLFNVLYLYWFGRLFMELVGTRPLLWTYLKGGLAGALMYLVSFNLLPGMSDQFPNSVLLGSSASVMAILFSVARFRPNHTVYLFLIGPVKLKYIALVAFLIDIISIPTLQNTGGHLAHIGGALTGLYLGWRWRTKLPSQKRSSWKWPNFKSPFNKKSDLKVTHRRPLTDMEYNAMKVQRQAAVDKILDKIKSSGYDSLSPTERKILFDASKDDI